MDYKKLFHKEEAFQRETFQKRMEEFGFKNMARMELFLWDLELFLHIQKILGDVKTTKPFPDGMCFDSVSALRIIKDISNRQFFWIFRKTIIRRKGKIPTNRKHGTDSRFYIMNQTFLIL